jgi:drug/metabolite transporter (DMT)-like permease
MLVDTMVHIAFKLAANAAMPVQFNTSWLVRLVKEPWVYVTVLCCVAAFITWITLLRRAPIGPAFAASHLELIGVLAVSAVLFGERISIIQFAGALLIVGGVACMALGSQSNKTA